MSDDQTILCDEDGNVITTYFRMCSDCDYRTEHVAISPGCFECRECGNLGHRLLRPLRLSYLAEVAEEK